MTIRYKRKAMYIFFAIVLTAMLSGCGHVGDYISFWGRHHDLNDAFQKEPSARLLNELSPEDSYLIQGRVQFNSEYKGSILVMAVTDTYTRREIVTARVMPSPVEFYLTYLPEGRYDIYFLADLNGNGYFDADEVVGMTSGMPITVSKSSVRNDLTVEGPQFTLDLNKPVSADFPVKVQLREYNYVYASLDDPFFNPEYGRMGLYDPKKFLAHTQRFFFYLEKFDPDKTPVIFVHGVDGTPRDFKYLVDGLDRNRYQPVFYFYPSGMPLQKLGSLFAELLRDASQSRYFQLKGVIVVAHSMGGLVALSGLDALCGGGVPSYLRGFVSFNSPYGGIEAIKSGFGKDAVVVPSWRDIVPGNPFLTQIYQRRTQMNFPFHMFFGYKIGESGDGTISLQSQLEPRVHLSADKSYGFNASHVGILNEDKVRQHFYRVLNTLN